MLRVLLLLLITTNVAAANRTWTGASSTNWSDAANWNPAGVPVSGDSLRFTATGAVGTVNNDLPAPVALTSVTFESSGYTVTGNAVHARFVNDLPCATTLQVPVVMPADDGMFSAAHFTTLDPSGFRVAFQHCGPVDGQLIGSGTITPQGASELRLTGGHPFSGTISGGVNAGHWTVLDGASLPDANHAGGQRITGYGTIADLEAPGTRVAPSGASSADGTIVVRNLTLAGSLSFPEQSFPYEVDITPTGNDVLIANGTVTLSNKPLTVNVTAALVIGQEIVIVANDGSDPVSGTFGRLSGFSYTDLPQGSRFTSGAYLFEIDYSGGDGNNVSLTVVDPNPPPPPPAATTVTVTASPAVAGKPVLLTIVVHSDSGTPTGELRIDAGRGVTPVPLMNGTADVVVGPFGVGLHAMSIDYLGDAAHAPSSAVVTVQVTPPPSRRRAVSR
ncbi:MAG TPA: Ig-like domain-containing protein [Thermoanaerobaculia bacterium]